jgi:hypothetical protein
MMVQRFRLPRRASALAMSAALLTASALTAPTVSAQSSYTCFPTCATNDGRFLCLAGSGLDAFAGNDITIGLGLPPNATSLELGLFDGDSKSGGYWDVGSYALDYQLWADPNGDGSGAILLESFSGSQMEAYDNAWYNTTRPIDTRARAANGNYVYYLRVSMDSRAPAGVRSSFKLRIKDGTITTRSYQSFSIEAPLTSGRDGAVIYPNYTSWDPANPSSRWANPRYDGKWSIYLDVLSPSSELTIWDGDMDHGTDPNLPLFPGQVRPSDTDDEDTPNAVPSWGVPGTVPEGVTGASPYDDNAAVYNRRSPSVRYDVIFPDGTTEYANDNPSGSLEWEQFKISTAPMNSSIMDAHADAIPAGIYQVQVEGMDMLNVNSWRFFNNVVAAPGTSNVEVIGVNELGDPVAPIRAIETVSGSISGTVYYDSDESMAQDPAEPGLPTVVVHCQKENADGTWGNDLQVTTNRDGKYTFSKLGAGVYKVQIETNSLQSDVIPTCDADGTTTAHEANFTISANSPNAVSCFGYERGIDMGTLTRGYWVNHPENWPVAGLYLGSTWYDQAAAMTILQRATRGDKSYSMAAQLIATKLNLANGTDVSCIGTEVCAADAWLDAHPMDRGRTPDDVWATGSAVHQSLDDYNNGRLCVGHMD